jgi:hypothetical protein
MIVRPKAPGFALGSNMVARPTLLRSSKKLSGDLKINLLD